MENKLDFTKSVVPARTINLDGFINGINIDEDTKVVLSILKKYDLYEIKYWPLKEDRNIYKCEIEFYPGSNITICKFSFLFQFKEKI
jgi:hypothetical protein